MGGDQRAPGWSETPPKALGGIRWKRSQRMGYSCLVLVMAHLIALGLRGWLAPYKWPWLLPSISLIAFVVAAFPVVVRLAVYREKGK